MRRIIPLLKSHLQAAVFLLCTAIIAAFTLPKYPGSALVYLIFTLVFQVLFLSGFRKNRIFFDLFAGFFLWMGFWAKLSGTLLLLNGWFVEPVGNFDFSGPAYDKTLLLASCAALALLAASFLRERIFSYAAVKADSPSVKETEAYSGMRLRLWGAFVSVVLLMAVANIYLGIYQRGLPPRTHLPSLLISGMTLLLLFGLAGVGTVLLQLEIKLRRNFALPAVLVLLESFFSNVSMLSRGMILNGSAVLMGGWDTLRRYSIRLGFFSTTGFAALFVALFAASIAAVNYLRAEKFSAAPSPPSVNITEVTPFHSFICRWVGLEGVMGVSSFPDKGWPLFKEALTERFQSTGTSFYDRRLVKDSPYRREGIEEKHFITLPGLVAFLYYPGSVIFLFAGVFLAALVAAGFEYFAFAASGRNLIFSALIGQIIASRYAHFGYAPGRTVLLFGGILLVSLGAWLFGYMLLRHKVAPSDKGGT